MRNNVNPKTVGRSLQQYWLSILWSIMGLPILLLVVFSKGEVVDVMWVLLALSFLHTLILALALFKPLIKIDSTKFIVYPNFFKKVVIPVGNIRCIRFHELIIKTKLTPQQQKLNNTLIIALFDGKEQSIKMLLTESVRRKILLLSSVNNIQTEYIAPVS